MMKRIAVFSLSIIFSAFVSPVAYSNNQCAGIYRNQERLVERIKESKAPAGWVQYLDKRIPAVLVNSMTIDSLRPILDRSLGIVVAHQKGYRNDHGLFRLQSYFIDRDLPGYRNRGEIHSTGIAWASVRDYVKHIYQKPDSYNRVEVVFDLNNQELETAIVYHKMRRAAMVRPDFTFGGDYNPKNVNNRLNDCGEICFSFSTGSAVRAQVKSIRAMIPNVDEIMKDTEVLNFVERVRKHILAADITSTDLGPELVSQFPVPKGVVEMGLPERSRIEMLNWIAGLALSSQYADLLETLSIGNSSDFSNARSSRASAIFVYDGNVTGKDFKSPNYVSEGVFSTWRNKGFSEL